MLFRPTGQISGQRPARHRFLRRRLTAAARGWAMRLDRGRLGHLLQLPVLVRCRERLAAEVLEMRADDVLEVVALLDAAGVRAWLAGGWAVDALNGCPTRRHNDLDLVLQSQPECTAAARLLMAAGYTQRLDQKVTTVGLSERTLLTDPAGRSVDLHAILPTSPLLALPDDALPGCQAFTWGMIRATSVRCLSAHTQLLLKQTHAARPKDLADIAVLRRVQARAGLVAGG